MLNRYSTRDTGQPGPAAAAAAAAPASSPPSQQPAAGQPPLLGASAPSKPLLLPPLPAGRTDLNAQLPWSRDMRSCWG